MKTLPSPSRTISKHIHAGARVRYRRMILDPDGTIVFRSGWKNNLILNSGLDQVAVNRWIQCFAQGNVGTGNTPTRRDSGVITATAAAGTITASAPFFVVGDVGRLIKFGTGSGGQEFIITAFTDSTHVTSSNTASQSAAVFTIWYVNDTALASLAQTTTSYFTGSSFNGSAYASISGTWTHTRSYLFAPVGGSVTYTEVGWSPAGSGTLFGRDLVPGGGDHLTTGQQYVVTIELTIAYTPVTVGPIANVGTGGFDTTGTGCIQFILTNQINTNGTNNFVTNNLDPSLGISFIGLASSTFTPVNATTGGITTPPEYSCSNAVATASYTSGDYKKTFSQLYIPTDAVGTIEGIFVDQCFCDLFNTPQTKDNLHSLNVVFVLSWGRILTN